jgi:sterol desaturase/sphingolipid hydroxylase (fatty acid hydroxylase superfamily)
MKINDGLIKKIIRDTSISILLYLLPILLMFVYFNLKEIHPWLHGRSKPALIFMIPFLNNLNSWGITTMVVAVGIIELLLGLYKKRWSINERILDIISLLIPGIIIQPLLTYFLIKFLPNVLPTSRNIFSWVPFWWSFFIILIAYDLTHYWVHRLHHEVPLLWRFHRTHHSAPYIGIWVDARVNLCYYILFSPVYLLIALAYLGLGDSILLFLIVKSLVARSAHSSIPWDKPLYRKKWLHPIAWVLERIISTPATHHAHHADSNDDGVGHYNGNFGNTLFIWDVIFGTALITRKYPSTYGIKHYQQEEWYAQFLWPFLKSRKKGSELSADNEAENGVPSVDARDIWSKEDSDKVVV